MAKVILNLLPRGEGKTKKTNKDGDHDQDFLQKGPATVLHILIIIIWSWSSETMQVTNALLVNYQSLQEPWTSSFEECFGVGGGLIVDAIICLCAQVLAALHEMFSKICFWSSSCPLKRRLIRF